MLENVVSVEEWGFLYLPGQDISGLKNFDCFSNKLCWL